MPNSSIIWKMCLTCMLNRMTHAARSSAPMSVRVNCWPMSWNRCPCSRVARAQLGHAGRHIEHSAPAQDIAGAPARERARRLWSPDDNPCRRSSGREADGEGHPRGGRTSRQGQPALRGGQARPEGLRGGASRLGRIAASLRDHPLVLRFAGAARDRLRRVSRPLVRRSRGGERGRSPRPRQHRIRGRASR